MRPRREIEIKLSVPDPRALKRRLSELGFHRLTARLSEANTLFDFPDRRLTHACQAVRLRTAGGVNLLTFKGPPSVAGGYKSRDEIETRIGDARELRRILEQLGLRECVHYQKRRTTYAPPGKFNPGSVLVYDETPVGNFIELEGPRAWINRVARQLGYGREAYITKSYVTLYMEGAARHRAHIK
ncbi:MAG: class IV adenylate cyclase [Terriglobia bacterium]